MIVVAISPRLAENDAYPEVRECLDVRWGRLCSGVGILPIILPTEVDPRAYFERFSPSGLILTGGNDLSSVSTHPLSRLRDAHEGHVLSLALSRGVPVLGVCRGMQFIAEHFGAKILPLSGHGRGVEHDIALASTTRFGSDLGALNKVRSYHDYGITAVPSDFDVVAKAPDGVVEAMEHKSLPIYCQMWHPERDDVLTDGVQNLFRSFFSAGA